MAVKASVLQVSWKDPGMLLHTWDGTVALLTCGPEASWGHAVSRCAPREDVAVMMYREARLGLPVWLPSTRMQCWRKLVEKELHNTLLEHKLT